jgi:O-antigen ligase
VAGDRLTGGAPTLLALSCAALFPLGYAASRFEIVHGLAALWTLILGTAGVAAAIAAARRGSFPLVGSVVTLLVCAAARFSITSAALLASGLLVGWWSAGDTSSRPRALIAGASALSCIAVLLMLAFGPDWPLGHPNHQALLVTTTWAAQLGLLVAGVRGRASLANALALSLALGALVLVFGRGQSVLAVCVVLALAALTTRSRVAIVGAGICTLALGAFVLTLDPDSLDTRLRLWRLALAGFREAPLFGLGPWGMHRALLSDDVARVQYWGGSDWPTDAGNAHDLGLQLLVQGGIVGAAVVLAAGAWCVSRGVRAPSPPRRAALWGFAAYLGVGVVSAAPFTAVGLFIGGLLGGLLAADPREELDATPVGDRARQRLAALIAAAAIGLTALIRPVVHEVALRQPPRLDRWPLEVLIWDDESYAALVNRWNAELWRHGRFEALHRLQLELVPRFGPRRSSLLDAAKAALLADDPQRSAQHCVEHLRWDPLLYFDECLPILRELSSAAGAGAAVDAAAERLPDLQRASLAILLGRKQPEPQRLLELLDGREPSIGELGYLAASARVLGTRDPDLALRALRVAREAAADTQHLPQRIESLSAAAADPAQSGEPGRE